MKFIATSICCLLVFTCVRADIEEEIIQGIQAENGQFLYVAYIQTQNSTTTFMCGGSIYKENRILTAAHCVCRSDLKHVDVLVGTHNRGGNKGGQWHKVDIEKNIKCHEEYNVISPMNDIALLKLEPALDFTKFDETFRPIQLPLSEVEIDPTRLTRLNFTGWGCTNTTNCLQNQATNLEFIELTVVSRSEEQKVLYAKSMRTNGGPCVGDSGGPLVDKDYFQYGIASKTCDICSKCRTTFTSVWYHKKWIENNSD